MTKCLSILDHVWLILVAISKLHDVPHLLLRKKKRKKEKKTFLPDTRNKYEVKKLEITMMFQ